MSKNMNYLIFFISTFSLISSLIVEIEDDFNLDIDYRLEKQESLWTKHGKLSFRKTDPSTYKSTASLIDFNFSQKMKKEIQNECKLKGNYILQFTNSKNISERYYSSINPCELISSNFHDKLIINSMTPIKQNKIKSLNYIADEDFEDEFDDDDDIEDGNKKQKGKKGFTKIELSKMNKLDGPIFSEEDDGSDEITKKKKEEKKKQPQSIFGRYWYIIAIVMFLMMFNQDQPQGQGQQQGAQGQSQGQGQGEAK